MAIDFSDLAPGGRQNGSAPASSAGRLDFSDLAKPQGESLTSRIGRATRKPAKVANTFMTWFTGLPQAGVRKAAVGIVGNAAGPWIKDKERFKREARDFVSQPLKTDERGMPAGKTIAEEATQLAAREAVRNPSKLNKAAGYLISATAPIAENLGDPMNVLLGLGSQLGRGGSVTTKLAGTLFSPDEPKTARMAAQDLAKATERPLPEAKPPLKPSEAKRSWKQANRAYERELKAGGNPPEPTAPDFLNRLKTNDRPIVLGPEGDATLPVETIRTAPVKEKTAFGLQRETLDRNIEDTFGTQADPVKRFLSEPLKTAVTEKTIDADSLRTVVQTKARELNIKPGSKDDLMVGDFVEGKLTVEDLRAATPKKADAIMEAAEFGRGVYRDLLTRVNAMLSSYGYKPIPERANYVTHTKQIQSFIDQMGSLILGKRDTLPTAISGINIETRPGRQFFAFGKQRQGGSTHEGLFKAIDAYIDPAMNQIHMTPVIQRYRAFQRFLQKEYPLEGGDKRLSGFNSWFSEFTNRVSGKKDIVDRPLEKKFGRRWLGTFDSLRRRTGANLVGGSVSAALTNFIPLTQSLATTGKPAALRGLGEALFSPFKDVRMIDGVRSAFLTRRFPKGTIAPGVSGKVREGAGFLFKMVDQFTSHAITAGKYWEGKLKGLDPKDAMKVADDFTARVMADRSFAQSPLIFDSKTLGAFTQFQVEVNNQLSFLGKDIPRNLGLSRKQIAASVAQVAIYSYLFNEFYERVTGRRPAIDPIHYVQRTVEQWNNGDPVLDMLNPRKSNAVSELANALPFSSILTGGRIPVSSVLPDPISLLQGDSTVQRELEKPLYGLLLPTGGSQVRKSVKGVQAFNRGFSETASGNYRFSIEESLPNFLRSLFFGEYATPEARDYFKESN